MSAMNTLITTIKFIAEGDIPSQVEFLGNPIYENGKIINFEIVNNDYNYNGKNSLDYTIDNFAMSVVGLEECYFDFNGYFTFNVLKEGKVEFELCITANVQDNLIDDIDSLFTSNNISVGDFVFKDDCYFFQPNMKVIEITKAEIDDIW